jgi:Domain of unknown function (DUF5655)
MTLDEFFTGHKESRRLFDAVLSTMEAIGPVELRVSKSQIAFRHGKAFAWVWIPGKYLRRKTAPLVLSLSFRKRESSPRWKEIVEPSPGRFMHHLELYSINDIDNEVHDWLRDAWINATS